MEDRRPGCRWLALVEGGQVTNPDLAQPAGLARAVDRLWVAADALSTEHGRLRPTAVQADYLTGSLVSERAGERTAVAVAEPYAFSMLLFRDLAHLLGTDGAVPIPSDVRHPASRNSSAVLALSDGSLVEVTSPEGPRAMLFRAGAELVGDSVALSRRRSLPAALRYDRERRRGRRRQTASLCLRARRLLKTLIDASQHTAGSANVTPQTTELSRPADARPDAGRAEFEDGERLFHHFEGRFSPADLEGREVLDLGCGYGGRTVFYARRCAARHVSGIEISSEVVERCHRLAAELECTAVDFSVGFAEHLRFPDESFDALVSFDVLEHVADPVLAIAEISRVLRPGGSAWLAFPTYLGARASHLDYLTRIPALHRVFDPDVIVEVVNEIIERDGLRFGVSRQPSPSLSSLGRVVLPSLNGMTLAEARAIVACSPLEVKSETLGPLIPARSGVPGARPLAQALSKLRRLAREGEFLIGVVAMHAVRTQ